MKFGYTIIYVEDVEKTVAFYERCFGLQRRFVDESGQFAEMETGGTALAFSHNSLMNSIIGAYRENSAQGEPAGMEICLLTDDVQAAYQKALDGGASSLVEPVVKPWGQTVAYVRDLNGFLVEIATPTS